MKMGEGFSRRVTKENLAQFAPLLGRAAERSKEPDADRGDGSKPRIVSQDLKKAEALFQGKSLTLAIPFTKRKPRTPGRMKRERARDSTTTFPETATQGPELWRKQLRASDVQRQAGNPTGGVRLTQARYMVGGSRIDQTTYFRETLFGAYQWTPVRQHPYRESATIPVAITILGKRYGVQQMEVSHKPSGEAGQKNYTTILHWGGLGPKVKQMNLVKRTLTLYGPPAGRSEPFSIDIT